MTKADKKAVRQLLRKIRWFNNGCACCASQDANQTMEYKTVVALSDYQPEMEDE